MSSPVHEDVVNQGVSRAVRRDPWKFMNVLMWNFVLFETGFFSVAYFTTLT
jgi:hypothetical protein